MRSWRQKVGNHDLGNAIQLGRAPVPRWPLPAPSASSSSAGCQHDPPLARAAGPPWSGNDIAGELGHGPRYHRNPPRRHRHRPRCLPSTGGTRGTAARRKYTGADGGAQLGRSVLRCAIRNRSCHRLATRPRRIASWMRSRAGDLRAPDDCIQAYYWDTELSGLGVVVGRTTKTFVARA